MSLRVFVTTGINRSSCHNCYKDFPGKGQEFFFRVSFNGCGKNFCAACLRKMADDVDLQNAHKKQTQNG